MQKRTFKVDDMTCANCAMKLESLEDELKGVHSVEASYHKGQMVVVYDEGQIDEACILAAVKKKGYSATAG